MFLFCSIHVLAQFSDARFTTTGILFSKNIKKTITIRKGTAYNCIIITTNTKRKKNYIRWLFYELLRMPIPLFIHQLKIRMKTTCRTALPTSTEINLQRQLCIEPFRCCCCTIYNTCIFNAQLLLYVDHRAWCSMLVQRGLELLLFIRIKYIQIHMRNIVWNDDRSQNNREIIPFIGHCSDISSLAECHLRNSKIANERLLFFFRISKWVTVFHLDKSQITKP